MDKFILQPQDLNNILDDKNLIIFDCRFNLLKKELGYKNYLNTHIKNAHYINLESQLSSKISEHSGRHPLPDIEKFTDLLNIYGVNGNSKIVIYDDENNVMSARFWWMLRIVGIKNCSVLDGGFKAWSIQGFPVDNLIPKNTKKQNNSYAYDEDTIVKTNNLEKMIKDEDFCLVDARENERFIGTKEPIDKKAGHIPGAINMPFKNNLDQFGKFKTQSELLTMFKKTKKNSAEKVINMCGSGVTACHNYLAMEYSGFGKSKLYVGSWSAWSSHEENKIKEGD